MILILPKEPELRVDYLRKWSISSEGSPGAELRAILRCSSKPFAQNQLKAATAISRHSQMAGTHSKRLLSAQQAFQLHVIGVVDCVI